jgi:hypothetical protein
VEQLYSEIKVVELKDFFFTPKIGLKKIVQDFEGEKNPDRETNLEDRETVPQQKKK